MNQLTFDGRTVEFAVLDIPGFGKTRLELDADEPKPVKGDRVFAGGVEWVITKEILSEKFNHDGYGNEEDELVYVCQGVRPFRLEGIKRRAEIDAAWAQKVSATG